MPRMTLQTFLHPEQYLYCPFCGFKYPNKVLREIALANIVYSTTENKALKTKRIKDMTNTELNDLWKIKGHKSPWLWRQLWIKGGAESIENFGLEMNWERATVSKAISFCRKF